MGGSLRIRRVDLDDEFRVVAHAEDIGVFEECSARALGEGCSNERRQGASENAGVNAYGVEAFELVYFPLF
jgi:hypothetical protein